MRLLCPSDSQKCLPLRIANGESDEGPRIGGHAPQDVAPTKETPKTRYFMTLPLTLDADTEVSFFLSLSFDQMLDKAGKFYSGPLVEAVVRRAEKRRGVGTAIRSGFDQPR